MKTSHFFYFLLAIILSSCNFGQANNDGEDYAYDSEYANEYSNENQNGEFAQDPAYQQNTNNQQNYSNQQNMNYQTSNNGASNGGGMKMHQIMNKQFGMPVGAMPIPSSWNRSNNTQEGLYFEGPGDIKVYNERTVSFFYSNDPQRNQFAQQGGSKVQPIKSLERVISEDIKPIIEQAGGRFIRQYPLPQLAQTEKRNDSYYFKATPENKQFQSMVTEWIDKEGKKGLVIFRYFVSQYTTVGGLDWGYTVNAMDASVGAFEDAKNACINALVNFQLNPQFVQANNRYYQQMAQQQNNGHQSRMAQIKAFGDANTARYNANSAASDARHNAYMSNSRASDKSQAAYVDGIWERQNMTDGNGNTYKVDGYDNKVWMNQNNETIGTDNTMWNPNTDNTTNGDNWNQLQSTDDGW